MIEELLKGLVEWIGPNGVPVGLTTGAAVAAYYGRHALKAGSVVARWFRFAIVGLVVLVVGLVTGVVSIDVDALVGVMSTLIDVVSGLV